MVAFSKWSKVEAWNFSKLLKLVNSTKAHFLFAGEIRAQMFWKKHQTNAHFLNDAFKNKEH